MKIILSSICLAIIFSTAGCSEILRPLTVKYQCHTKEVPNPQTTGEFVKASQYHYIYGEFDCAYAAAEEAYRLKKNNPKAIIARGYAHFGLKEYSSALTDFRVAIMLDGKDHEAFEGRSWVFEEYKDLTNAIADMSTAIENAENAKKSNFDIALLINRRGRLYSRNGDYNNALKDLSETIRLKPDWGYFYSDRAKLYRKMGKVEEALADEEMDAKLKVENDRKEQLVKN